jgi:hypothetical protein
LLDSRLALVRRQVQDLQIFPVRPCRQRLVEQIVGDAETTAGKQFLSVAIIRQRSRLAHQRVDHVPVIDVPLATTPQPRQRFHQLLAVPHLHLLQVKPHFDPFADQPAVHRVHIVLHANHAAGAHRHFQPLARLQTPRRQGSQHRLLEGQPLHAAQVALPAYLVQERLVLPAAGKVPTAAQQQGLRHRVFEMPMRRLDIAVFVGFPRLDLLPHNSVMFQQPLVTLREVPSLRQIVHGAAHPVAAVPLGHATQFPQRVLQAHTQALEALGETERHRLPVRVGQHEVIHQVIEGLPTDGHVQTAHVGEVRGTQSAGMMDLAKVHFLAGSARAAPLLQPPLQRPQLTLVKPSRILLLEPAPERLGLEARCQLQLLGHFRPNLGERVYACSPKAW